jgi:hypothetical protein
MLTQTCIACYNSTEFKQISKESLNLLVNINLSLFTFNTINFSFSKNVLDNLNKSIPEPNENADTNNALLSLNFEIVNLKDSLNLIENLKSMELSEWDLKNGI